MGVPSILQEFAQFHTPAHTVLSLRPAGQGQFVLDFWGRLVDGTLIDLENVGSNGTKKYGKIKIH